MRATSIVLSLFLHLAVLFGGVYSAKWSSRTVQADLGKRVYQVRVIKKAAPVKLEKMQPVRKVASAKPVPTAKTQISPIKVPKPEPKKEPAEKTPPKKQEPSPEEVMAQAMKEAEQQAAKEKAREEAVLAQELASLREELAAATPEGGSSGGEAGGSSGLEGILSQVVKSQVQQNWRYPVVGNQPNYMAKVQITIDPSGKISSKLLKSSGRADFDSSVMRAVRETEQLNVEPPKTTTFNLNFYLDELMQ